MTERDDRRIKIGLCKAKLRLNACVEDVDFRHKRGLDKAVFMQLPPDWMAEIAGIGIHLLFENI